MRSPKNVSALVALATPILGVAAWHVAVTTIPVPPYILPAPAAVFGFIVADAVSLTNDLLTTAYEALVGLAIAVAFSTAMAIAAAQVPTLIYALSRLSVAIQSIPILAIAPFLTLWFGPEEGSKVAAAAIVAVFPLTSGWAAGLQSQSTESVHFARMMFPRVLPRTLYYGIPSALPYFSSALAIAAPLAVLGAIVAEFVGASRGLGFRILTASYYLRTDEMFAAVLLACGLSLLLFWLIGIFNTRTLFWHGEHARNRREAQSG